MRFEDLSNLPPQASDEDGNRLWNAVENLSGSLGLLDNVNDCSGTPGQDIVNFSRSGRD